MIKGLLNRLLKNLRGTQYVMLSWFQHFVKSVSYETLNQVQGDKEGLFQRPVRGLSKGFTLIEVVVVIVILSIVSGITVKFLVDSMRIYTMTVNQKTLFDEAKLALERMCRDIRDAQAIATPTPGNSGNLITFTRTNGTGSTATDPVLDHAGEVVTFQWDGISGDPLVKIKQNPVNPTTVQLAEFVTAFTVTCGVVGTYDSNWIITLVLTLRRTTGENVTLQTEVYPNNLPEDTSGPPPTYKNFRVRDSSGNYTSWQEVLSP
jgi:prepilin-type N-terminal cleavage/methylation domain-containing protein